MCLAIMTRTSVWRLRHPQLQAVLRSQTQPPPWRSLVHAPLHQARACRSLKSAWLITSQTVHAWCTHSVHNDNGNGGR
jgi:hypothetical protein